MEVKDDVELTHDSVVVAVGTVFSASPSDVCQGLQIGEDRVIIQVSMTVVPESPIPYPTTGVETVTKTIGSYILWDKSNCRAFKKKDHVVVEHHQKIHYHTTKRKLCTAEEKTIKKLQKRGAAKLTNDSIQQAIAKDCGCPQQCWRNWSLEDIREERKNIHEVKHDQKLDCLFAKIDASKDRKDGMVLFKNDYFVCKKAFYSFYGIAKSSFYAYKSRTAKMEDHMKVDWYWPKHKLSIVDDQNNSKEIIISEKL